MAPLIAHPPSGREPDVRRIQKTGHNTFIVSLPKTWADRHAVRAGTLAHVSENADGSLRIDVHFAPKNRIAAVDADGEQALRNLISAYIAGAEQIVLNGQKAAEMGETAREYLSAIDVIAEAPRQVTLRVFATGQEFELSVLLKRLHAVALSLFDAAARAFAEPVEAQKTAAKREREANRLYTLALRTMGAERSSAEFKFEALAANALENIADQLEHFVAERPKHGRALLPKVRAAYEQTAANFFQGRAGASAVSTAAALSSELDGLAAKSALEWARLHDVLRYCVELEDTAADLDAIRELAKTAATTATADADTPTPARAMPKNRATAPTKAETQQNTSRPNTREIAKRKN